MSRMGLRTRVSAAFAVGALLLSACVALISYELVRSTLLSERERTAVRATYFDAAVVDAGLAGSDSEVIKLLQTLDTGADRYVLLELDGRWYSRAADTDAGSAVPARLQAMAERGEAGAQRVRRDGQPALVVAVPLSSTAVFYEVVSLRELERTLQVLALVLTAVAIMVAGAGAALGWYVTRHALHPLTAVAGAARTIADGDLDARLDPHAEPDLAELSMSFNHMADELNRRIERDRRFAADVSHELRSPLQTLAAAASVIDRRRAGLDPNAAAAVGLLTGEITRFQALVEDLLELAGGDRPAHRESVDVAQLIGRVCRSRGIGEEVLQVRAGTATSWQVDPRRLEQALGNLLDNAVRHGDKVIAVRIGCAGAERCFIEVDDAGPGVAEEDRELIFGRFVRGRAAHSRGDTDGTGLGLSIVEQHAAAHQGSVTVHDRPGGGARFRIELAGCLP
ncbi:HAMP domain-containing sensor histidine kinase [Solwaraspora sp. WMMD1047]|uniref:sensor histidine kinase n=1 Tax=Solwaraspora sp. WMMD1047 TaxID=3016102 RepID=UPI002417CD8C|nr:HAMP domain-containing sensor histidine kinase [Solwaraspora sp. WMMD1047]MDG4831728.1 HAMP domain-containing sensor histidine kinase [Solwaraspora sp. WMMD1047]